MKSILILCNFMINFQMYIIINLNFLHNERFLNLNELILISNNSVVTGSHEGDSGDGDSKHACMIAIFLLVRLLYLLIHSLNHLFRSIQTFVIFADFIDFIVIFLSIACCSSNLFLKLTFSH